MKCNQAFSANHSLINHVRIAHEGLKSYQCKLCEKAFMRSVDLKDHIKNIHVITSSDFKCDMCDEIFTQKSDVVAHIRKYHEVSVKSIIQSNPFDEQDVIVPNDNNDINKDGEHFLSSFGEEFEDQNNEDSYGEVDALS